MTNTKPNHLYSTGIDLLGSKFVSFQLGRYTHTITFEHLDPGSTIANLRKLALVKRELVDAINASNRSNRRLRRIVSSLRST